MLSDDGAAKRVLSQLKRIARAIYSNPPVHGARIVAEVVGNEDMFTEWKEEMEGMAGRIKVSASVFTFWLWLHEFVKSLLMFCSQRILLKVDLYLHVFITHECGMVSPGVHIAHMASVLSVVRHIVTVFYTLHPCCLQNLLPCG